MAFIIEIPFTTLHEVEDWLDWLEVSAQPRYCTVAISDGDNNARHLFSAGRVKEEPVASRR